jgi:predicted N-formylglutamate amidohydrolase
MSKNLGEMGAMAPARIINGGGAAPILLVCEHASNHIPDEFDNLGLNEDVRQSHVAWDPGAAGVARNMSEMLDAPLVECQVSRLVYDCNRPPDAPDAMPERSEVFDIPGNRALSDADKARRTEQFYLPFRAAVAEQLAARPSPSVLVTIHSFTPIYLGKPRAVELGILHDEDRRLADEMLRLAPEYTSLLVGRNDPYGPEDGVTHTLREHALPNGVLNVMLEIRNDLIDTEQAQRDIAGQITKMAQGSLERLAAPVKTEVGT